MNENIAKRLAELTKRDGENVPEIETKKVKKDRGLLERTKSSKKVITEDNKLLLND
jgi:hypothetical protein